jgi:hypothetical protein
MDPLSTFLYARPSLLEGSARLIDFGGFLNEYNTSVTGEVADSRALATDWYLVGGDVCAAIAAISARLEEESRGQKKQKPGRSRAESTVAAAHATAR